MNKNIYKKIVALSIVPVIGIYASGCSLIKKQPETTVISIESNDYNSENNITEENSVRSNSQMIQAVINDHSALENILDEGMELTSITTGEILETEDNQIKTISTEYEIPENFDKATLITEIHNNSVENCNYNVIYCNEEKPAEYNLTDANYLVTFSKVSLEGNNIIENKLMYYDDGDFVKKEVVYEVKTDEGIIEAVENNNITQITNKEEISNTETERGTLSISTDQQEKASQLIK